MGIGDRLVEPHTHAHRGAEREYRRQQVTPAQVAQRSVTAIGVAPGEERRQQEDDDESEVLLAVVDIAERSECQYGHGQCRDITTERIGEVMTYRGSKQACPCKGGPKRANVIAAAIVFMTISVSFMSI